MARAATSRKVTPVEGSPAPRWAPEAAWEALEEPQEAPQAAPRAPAAPRWRPGPRPTSERRVMESTVRPGPEAPVGVAEPAAAET